MQERGPARQLIMTVLRAKCHLQLQENISRKCFKNLQFSVCI